MIKLSAEEVRIFVLAPRGRDAILIAETLAEGGLRPVVCADAGILIRELREGGAAAIIAEEALAPAVVENLVQSLGEQAPWSDLPIVVLTSGGRASWASAKKVQELEVLGNITFLERPVRPDTVRSAMRAALRVRMRQYELRHRQEILTRVNSDLERFAYSASHDLQEPIRNVAIFSEILAMRYGDLLDEEGLHFLGNIRSAAGRMQSLVRDLLSYTQVASIVDEVPEPCEADAAVEAALSFLKESIPTDGLITHAQLPPVKVGAIHLQQMFQNLISNAIKYRSDEPLRVDVSAENTNGFWRFAVADNGIGIKAEYKEQIFGIFKRLHTQQKYPGTGIGLAICQRIAERYGGRIWVESDIGRGSTFFFTVPV